MAWGARLAAECMCVSSVHCCRSIHSSYLFEIENKNCVRLECETNVADAASERVSARALDNNENERLPYLQFQSEITAIETIWARTIFFFQITILFSLCSLALPLGISALGLLSRALHNSIALSGIKLISNECMYATRGIVCLLFLFKF